MQSTQPYSANQTPLTQGTPAIPSRESATSKPQDTGGDGLYGKPALLAMLGIAFIVILVSLDQTIVSTALPRIVAELNGFHLYPWVATSYLLTSTVCIPLIGKLSDLYGRKPFLLVAVALFVTSSAVGGASRSMLMLILSRAVQGIGSGMFLATAFTSVGDIFPQPERRARWQGLLSSTFGVSSMIGPSLGGIMTDTLGWRSIFYVNLPIGILAMLVIWRKLPADLSPRKHGAKIDWWGAVAIMVCISALLLAVEWGGTTFAWTSPPMLTLVGLSLVFLVGFVVIEHRFPEPLIPPDLFTIRAVVACTLNSFLTGFVMFGLIFYTPLFIQGAMGLSPAMAGAIQTPLVVGMSVGSLTSGQIYSVTRRTRPLILIGTLFLFSGTLLLTQATPHINPLLLSAELALCGIGTGMQWPIMLVIIQIVVPRSDQGVGNSLIRFLRLIGSMMGTAIMGTLVSSLFIARLDELIPKQFGVRITELLQDPQVLVQPAAQEQLRALAGEQGAGVVAQLEQVLAASRSTLASSIQTGYVMMCGVALLAVLTVLVLLPKDEEPTT